MLKQTYILYLLVSLFIILGALSGFITFGHGLGDIGGLITIAILLVVVTGIAWLVRRTKDKALSIVFSVILFALTVFFFLRITLLRGPEYRWNGHLFYSQ